MMMDPLLLGWALVLRCCGASSAGEGWLGWDKSYDRDGPCGCRPSSVASANVDGCWRCCDEARRLTGLSCVVVSTGGLERRARDWSIQRVGCVKSQLLTPFAKPQHSTDSDDTAQRGRWTALKRIYIGHELAERASLCQCNAEPACYALKPKNGRFCDDNAEEIRQRDSGSTRDQEKSPAARFQVLPAQLDVKDSRKRRCGMKRAWWKAPSIARK